LKNEWRDFVQAKQVRPERCGFQSTPILLSKNALVFCPALRLRWWGISVLEGIEIPAF
jgi:hypothetical protein